MDATTSGASFLRGRLMLLRTAKSCGPGIPTLMPNLRVTLARRAGDGGQKARRTGESTYKP